MGDLNVTLRPEDTTGSPPPPTVVAAARALLDHIGVSDIAPIGAPHTFSGSWKGKPYSMRLDHIYCSPDSDLAPKQLPAGNPGLSDHTPVICSLLVGNHPPTSPLWRFSTSQ